MAERLGWLLADGLRVPLHRIHLEYGQVVFTGFEPGPRRARSGPVEIWAPDGSVVAAGGHITTEAVGEDQILKVEIRVDVSDVRAAAPPWVVIQGTVLQQGETR